MLEANRKGINAYYEKISKLQADIKTVEEINLGIMIELKLLQFNKKQNEN